MNYKRYQEITVLEDQQRRISKSEMSDSQINFICSLMKQYRPHKVVEVGVSAGGTSVEIINYINHIDLKCEMYSVDLAERYYRDTTKPCGYLVDEISDDKKSYHKLLLGKALPMRLDEIKEDIDFLILDTAHIMPGEVLDFLAVLPYLKENAIVVLHDTALHHCGNNSSKCIATNVLFQAVTADKFLNNFDEFPNIAAFRINEDTEKYILDVFCALMLPWEYVPDEEQMEAYHNIFSKYYDNDAVKLWNQARAAAAKCIGDKKRNICDFWEGIKKAKERQVYIYGAGGNAKLIYDFVNDSGIKACGFIVSDGQPIQEPYKDTPVYFFSELPQGDSTKLVIMSFGSEDVENLLDSTGYEWFYLPYQILETLAYK